MLRFVGEYILVIQDREENILTQLIPKIGYSWKLLKLIGNKIKYIICVKKIVFGDNLESTITSS